MLAPSKIPEKFLQWNLQHGAPHGKPVRPYRLKKFLLSHEQFEKRRGPFALQPNNSTRAFEYPWAFETGNLRPGMKILEIGGGLAGFQFVLDASGCSVVNVDPGTAAHGVGWPCDPESMAQLNRRFNTRVELRNMTVDRAQFSENEFDRIFSISVIEHLPCDEVAGVMFHAFRSLKPGGLFILTVDLFLNIHPFSSRAKNEYGVNQNLRELLGRQPWELTVGQPDELFGFSEFQPDNIMRRLETYLLGTGYPALVQCLVLKKPAG